MEAIIRKWGNSPALRLPMSVLKEAALGVEQKVNIVVTRGRIVIEPSQKIEYDLNELLAGINPENAHTEVSFGKPVGIMSVGPAGEMKMLSANISVVEVKERCGSAALWA